MKEQRELPAAEIKLLVKEALQITNKKSDRIQKELFYGNINNILMKSQIIKEQLKGNKKKRITEAIE